jgi:hypothetical protein
LRLELTPNARLNAVCAHRDGFSEEGADILDLTVEEDDLNSCCRRRAFRWAPPGARAGWW